MTNEQIAKKLVDECSHSYPKNMGACWSCILETLDTKDSEIASLQAKIKELEGRI